LLLPTLARLTRAGLPVVLVAPPYLPFPVAWRQAGVDLAHLHVVDAPSREALWAAEQCLRAGCTGAVLAWPPGSKGAHADDRALRRLQVAADSGPALGFVFRDLRALANPSPAALRLAIQGAPPRLRVVKCRGGTPPARAVGLSAAGCPTMLWACIHLPTLALDGVLRRHPRPEAPLALVGGPAQRRVLVAVNAAAARAGLHRGQALAAA